MTAPRRPMEPIEINAAVLLGSARFSPGSFHKRFARQLAAQARTDNPTITQKQAALLWELCWRYRKQITGERGVGVLDRAAREREKRAAEKPQPPAPPPRFKPLPTRRGPAARAPLDDDTPGLFGA